MAKRPVSGLETEDDESVAPLTFAMQNVAEDQLLERLTCEAAKAYAASNSDNRALAERVRRSCRNLATLVARAERDMVEYVDLLFAHVARMLPDGWLLGPMEAYSMQSANWLAEVHYEPAVTLVVYGSDNSQRDMSRHRYPAIRDQVNRLVELIRTNTTFDERTRLPYVFAGGLINSARLRDAHGNTALERVYAAGALRRYAGAAAGIIAALRSGVVSPRHLVVALAQALLLSPTMNGGAIATPATFFENSVDIADALRLANVQPSSLAWIEGAAQIAALDDPQRQLTIGEARRLMGTLGIDARAPLPPRPVSSTSRRFHEYV